MPEDLKLTQIGSSPLHPPFRGLHFPGVRKLSNYLRLLFPEIVYSRLCCTHFLYHWCKYILFDIGWCKSLKGSATPGSLWSSVHSDTHTFQILKWKKKIQGQHAFPQFGPCQCYMECTIPTLHAMLQFKTAQTTPFHSAHEIKSLNFYFSYFSYFSYFDDIYIYKFLLRQGLCSLQNFA